MGLSCALCGRALSEESSQRTVYGDVGRECFRKLDSKGVLLREEFDKMKPQIQDQLARRVQDIKKTLSDSHSGTLERDLQYLKDTKGDYKTRMQDFPGMAYIPKHDDFTTFAKRDPGSYRLDLILQDIDTSALIFGRDKLPEWGTLFTKNMQYRDILAQVYLDFPKLFAENGDTTQLAEALMERGITDQDTALALSHLIGANFLTTAGSQGMTKEELLELSRSPAGKKHKDYFDKLLALESDGNHESEEIFTNGFSNSKFLNNELSTREWNQLKPDDTTSKSLHALHKKGKISAEDYKAIEDAMKEADERFLREKGTVVMANNHDYNVFGDGIDATSTSVPKNWAQAISDSNTAMRNFKRASSDCVASIKDIELSVQDKKSLPLHSSSLMFLSPSWKELESKGYMGAILQMKDGNVIELALIKKPVPGFTSVYAPSTAQEVFNGFLKKYPAVKSNPFGNSKNYEYLILAPGPVSETNMNGTFETPSVKEQNFMQIDGLHLFALNASPRMSPERAEEGTHLTQVAYTLQAATSTVHEVSPLRWQSAIKPTFGGSAARFAPTLRVANDKEELTKAFENPRVLKNINESLTSATYLDNKRQVTTYKDFIQNELSLESKSLGDKLHSYSLSSAVLSKRDGRNLDASEVTNQDELDRYVAGHFGTNSATTRLADAITRAQTNSDADPTFKNITSSVKRITEVFSASNYMKEGKGLRGYKAEDLWAGHETRNTYFLNLSKPILSKHVKDGKEKEALDSMKVNSDSRKAHRNKSK